MKSSFIWLIRLYTVILSVTVVLATAVLIWSNVHSYNAQMAQAETTVVSQLSDAVTKNQQVAKQFASQITARPGSIENLNKYFSSSLMAYTDYATDKSIESGQYFYWPTESRIFLIQHPEVNQLTLRLTNQKKVFVATQTNSGGKLVNTKNKLVKNSLAMNTPLVNQFNYGLEGVIGLTFSHADFKNQLKQLSTLQGMQIFLQTDANSSVFYFAGKNISKNEQKLAKRAVSRGQLEKLKNYRVIKRAAPSDYSIVMIMNREKIQRQIFWQIIPAVLFGLVLLVALSSGLHLVFRRYQTQLKMIVATSDKLSKGNLEERIPVVPQNNDLRVVAEGINKMLDEIHDHVYTIYQLKIANQEANIRALQAQINPHFLSNTLEYIRMAALDADQPELANVVYNFAALLRNNIDFSPMSTLKDELSFVDKYVFLYQVRFPDRLAYQIKIAPDVTDVKLPKFTLQPLVENYFVHGVDFSKIDNALSIKAWRTGDQVNILVKNNGRPLSPERVKLVNQKMADPNNADERTSIGLQNVYLRMKEIFGATFAMSINSDGVNGVQIMLQFRDQQGE